VSLLATAQLVKKALGSNPAFLQGVENILFLLIQGTVRSPVSPHEHWKPGSALFCVWRLPCKALLRIRDVYPGSWLLSIADPGSRMPDAGSRIPDLGSRIQDLVSRIQDLGSRIPDLGSRIPERGSRSVFRISGPGSNNDKRGGRGKNCCLMSTFL
jgi:hypothetical protein